MKVECDSLKASLEASTALVVRLEADLEVKLLRADRSTRFGGGATVSGVRHGMNLSSFYSPFANMVVRG